MLIIYLTCVGNSASDMAAYIPITRILMRKRMKNTALPMALGIRLTMMPQKPKMVVTAIAKLRRPVY